MIQSDLKTTTFLHGIVVWWTFLCT